MLINATYFKDLEEKVFRYFCNTVMTRELFDLDKFISGNFHKSGYRAILNKR